MSDNDSNNGNDNLIIYPDNKFKRCESDDPNRCVAILKGQTMTQCPYKALPGATTCAMHNGHSAIDKAEKQSIRNYRLAKWQNRINDFADNPQAKSLREEIGVLRMVLEEILNSCKEPEEILTFASAITDTVLKIEKVVASCHRLEASTGALLDKQSALHLASCMVDIISRHVTNEESINSISDEIILAITQTSTVVKIK